MKIQVPDWHGEDWQDLTGNNEAHDAQSAAEKAAELFIYEAAAYDRIGNEPITVHVDDGSTVTTWRVETEATFNCYATEKQSAP